MVTKRKLYNGDIVKLRDGRMGYIALSPSPTVCIRGVAISSYNANMEEENCYSDVDVVSVFYTSKHTMEEIAEKYIALANEHDNGVWDE